MIKRCKGKTKSGQPCQATAGADGFCTFHSPAHGAARAIGRKRGGQRHRVPHVADPSSVKTPIRDVSGVMALLDVAAIDTLAQENSAQRTKALVAVALAYFRGLEVGEIEQRLEAIEQALKLGGPEQ
jgi:hypothetical protein